MRSSSFFWRKVQGADKEQTAGSLDADPQTQAKQQQQQVRQQQKQQLLVAVGEGLRVTVNSIAIIIILCLFPKTETQKVNGLSATLATLE